MHSPPIGTAFEESRESSDVWDELLEFEHRFRKLAQRMLRQFPKVRRWEETDDVIQSALIRLHECLRAIDVKSPLHFRRLAALTIRRQLLDLARRFSQPSSHAANHESCQGNPPDLSDCPQTPTMDEWARFHECVEKFPPGIQETFDLIWYGGLNQEEAADQLGISLRQCQRRWCTARVQIARQVSANRLLGDS